MKIKLIYILPIILCIYAISVNAQQWASTQLPLKAFQIRSIYTDTVNQKVYVAGVITLSGTNNTYYNTVCIYNTINHQWSHLDTIDGIINTLSIYNNELYVGGAFTIHQIGTQDIAKWTGTSWQSIGTYTGNGITKLKVINNILYALGDFSIIGGIQANKVAKYDGNNWSEINNFPLVNGITTDMAIFNNDIYIAGAFYTTSIGNHIIAFKNNSWQTVGSGILGSVANLFSLQVYNNELYATGTIYNYNNNPGQGIQKWNGQIWQAVGTGFYYNNNYGLGQSLSIHNNKLYASGAFNYAGNISANGIATWDGSKWCSINNQNIGTIQTFSFINDTLYASTPFDTINNNYVNRLVKIYSENPADTCSIEFNSIPEQTNNLQLTIYPNPTSNTITIETNFNERTDILISVYSSLGQLLYKSKSQKVSGQFKQTLNLSAFSQGIYFVNVNTDKQLYSSKVIKN
jgi:hypothetical protein